MKPSVDTTPAAALDIALARLHSRESDACTAYAHNTNPRALLTPRPRRAS